MAWTYNPTLPTDRDRVRLRIGDVDANDQLITDEEITAVLNDYATTDPNRVIKASIRLAEALAARYGRLSMRSVKTGDDQITYGDLARHYRALAAALRGATSVRLRRGAFPDYTTGEGEEAAS